ncbi:MAG: hypothetical protein WAO12_11530 [Venatoribacter sp.]
MQSTPSPWTEQEYEILIQAIEASGGNSILCINYAKDRLDRSVESITRKLKKMGYLRSYGSTFSGKLGFVR